MPTQAKAALATVLLSAALLGSGVVGILGWKATEARANILRQNAQDLRNLAHSLAQHASQTLQTVDLTLGSIAERTLYDPPPPAERVNRFLRARQVELPQVREFAVLDDKGDWRYSSLATLPTYNNAERPYFQTHRDNPSTALRINRPFVSKGTGRWTVLLSRRLSHEDGGFAGVALAAIDLDFFRNYYRSFNLGTKGGIGLLRADGKLIAHTLTDDGEADHATSPLFQTWLPASPVGSHDVISPFDGLKKSIAYEKSEQYPVVVTVAQSQDEVLQLWWADVQSDVLIAIGFVGIIALVATALAGQFRSRLRVERSLRDRESRYRLLAENAGDIVIQLKADGTITYVSPAVEAMLGWTEAALVGLSCVQFVHPDDGAKLAQLLSELAAEGGHRATTYRMRKQDYAYLWVEANLRSAAGGVVVGSLRDVSERMAKDKELRALNRKLASLATTDGLTGLANRRALDQFLRRHDQSAFSLMMIDIDHFKLYNDQFGHLSGDECLRKVAGAIADAIRESHGFVARYGGEEFAVVLPGITPARASLIGDTLRLGLRALAIDHPRTERGHVTISVGISGKYDETMTGQDVLREADLALYEAKRLGRNRTVVFELKDEIASAPLSPEHDDARPVNPDKVDARST